MFLVRQCRLVFQGPKSRKVYEVELCDLGDGEHLVNFRYGREGGRMREGSKPKQPVSLSKAEAVYDKVVQTQIDKGYLLEEGGHDSFPPEPVVATTTASAAPAVTTVESLGDPQADAILRRLTEGIQEAKSPSKRRAQSRQTRGSKPWPVERAIWRVGELKLKPAVPLLISLADLLDDMGLYCIAWSLGRCGDSDAIPCLETMLARTSLPAHVKRMSQEALWSLLSDAQRTERSSALMQTLPASLQAPLSSQKEMAFAAELSELVAQAKPTISSTLSTLYLLTYRNPWLRTPLLETVRKIPLEPPFFRALRGLLKSSELRLDAELFGLIAYRIEMSPPMFRMGRDSYVVSVGDDYVERGTIERDRKKNNARYAYSGETRDYLRRRIWRTLLRLGRDCDAETYVKMAVGVLLPYKDADGGVPASNIKTHYAWRRSRYETTETHFDSFSKRHVFNQVLYRNSLRYECKKNSLLWLCKDRYKPGDAAPHQREEAFTRLWDQAPVGLLHLLSESQCQRVHEFAVRAVRANDSIKKLVDVPLLVMLLGRPYEVTMRLGVDFARQLQHSAEPAIPLVKALFQSTLPQAHKLAKEWVAEHPDFYCQDLDLISSLLCSSYSDIRRWSRLLLRDVTYNTKAQQTFIASSISCFMTLKEDTKVNHQRVQDIATSLEQLFPEPLTTMSLDVIRDLLGHPLISVQRVGTALLLLRKNPSKDLPQEVLLALLHSDAEEARAAGIRLLGEQSEEELLLQRDLLLTMCVSSLDDVRREIRPLVEQLTQKHLLFAEHLAVELSKTLLHKEAFEGLHEHVLGLLQHEMAPVLSHFEQPHILRLLHAASKEAQTLGFALLDEHVEPTSLSIRELTKLSDHEVRHVREWGWTQCREQVATLKSDMSETVRLLDASWEDTRVFAFSFFREHFDASDWNPVLLVSICDSVREDVQAFGRSLITKFFKKKDGVEYLTKLSQHRSADLQLFATNYLEKYASGNLERLASLEYYMTSVLCRVNQGRVAKDRILAFLRKEALAKEESARLIAPVLERYSLTISVIDKANCLELMRDIHEKFPDVSLPIQIQSFPKRDTTFDESSLS